MRLTAVLFVVGASLVPLPLALYAAGQNPPAAAPTASAPAKPPVAFQVNANLVMVDVVLSDKGAAVRGLPQDKFHVYENGVLQKMTVFEEHKAEDGIRATGYPPLAPGTYSDFPQYKVTSAANVLLLDALNTPLSDQIYVRQQMLEYLKNIPPGTRIAVFTLASRLRIVEGFTTDSNVIAKALSGRGGPQQSVVLDSSSDQQASDQMNDMSSLGASQGALSSMQQFQADLASFQTDLRVQMTLDAMKTLARYLSAIPGRKNLVWFSGSFPLAIEPDATLSSPFQAMRMYADDLRQTDNMLSAARVAVYPVDARGLMTLPSANAASSFSSGGWSGGSSGHSGGLSPGKGGGKGGSGHGSGGLGSGGGGVRQPAAAAADQKFLSQTAQEHFSMQQIAEETGGEAFADTNGLKEAVARAIADGSHYYTVGYVPALKEYDGAFRHIRVDVEGGYQAAYRHGYYADDPTKAAVNPQASQNPMNGAVVRGAPPLAEILFKVRVLSADDPRAKGVKLTSEPAGQRAKDFKGPATRYLLDFAVDPHPLGFSTTADGVRHARVEFALIAYDGDGKQLNSVDRGVAINLTDALYQQVMHGGIPVHQEIDLPEGVIYLRLVVHDLDTSKVGSTEVPVIVAKK
jgi:VWFA-related protein